MGRSISEFARSAAAASRKLDGFEATETIRAGGIEVTARVRSRRPDKCAVEFSSYRSPLSELEERLVNGAEFTEDELAGMSFSYDGAETWASDPKTMTVIRKASRSLPEPLPGFRALGEIGFLEDVTHDFLVRDAGEETVEGRACRLLGLKPRETYRSQLLKTVTFPIRRAVIALDKETLFPRRIRFFPARNTVLSSLVHDRGPVSIEYTDLRLEAAEANAFSVTPPEGSRVFRETSGSPDELAGSLPFPLPLDSLLERGYRPIEGGGTAAVDAPHGRGYCTFALGKQEDDRSRVVTLRVGNYLSRNMSRRRAAIAEGGTATTVRTLEGRILDRGSRWAQEAPQEIGRQLLELSWVDDELFCFLLGDGLDREKLLELSSAFSLSLRGEPAPPTAPS